MAKFHINEANEVKPCHAKQKCRFGGASGQENHFGNKEQAEAVAQKRLQQKFGSMATTVRASSQKKATHKLKELEAKGVKIKTVTSVKTHKFSKEDPAVSTVDILNEKPAAELLASIRSGKAAETLFN